MVDSNDNQKIKDYIDKESERFAIAHAYRLDNPFLTQSEKIEVELWFQFPETIMFISLCACMLYSVYNPISIKLIIGIPMALDLVVGLINWTFYFKKFLRKVYLTIGHNFVLWALTLVIMGILLYHGLYAYSAIVLVSKLGLLNLISPSMYTYTTLSKKYNMHAKWAFFKRFYGHKFPFEK
jgi:hypothetical protein